MWMICSVAAMNLEWVRADLQKKYEVKGRVMVEGNSEIKFLGRIIARNEHGRKTPSTSTSCWRNGAWSVARCGVSLSVILI